MPLLSAMVKLFTGVYESPSRKESEGEVMTDSGNTSPNSGNTSPKTLVSPKRSPLLQNLNRNNGNSVVMKNTENSSAKDECGNEKKRRREISSDEDEENLLGFQKKRKVCMSAGDDFQNLCSHNATNGDLVSRDVSLCLDSMLDMVRQYLNHFEFSFSAR
ncbi:uncharacterized protein LOC114529584 isoform X2 [Dendronephthya gigantea]|uniref:uncharacterized protein LOC114529584 isoform X2 n=1 Tax=Dendronephthya gigantea TaxID=151771 RepID=UPI00106AEC67|nr:uncharacterized protein LOC114529584 isoform X2 [Dendronephthya gigantea]